MQRLLRRSALAVDRRAGDLLRHPGREPRGARDVAGLGTDGVDASEEHVVDRERIDLVAVEQRADHVGAEVGRVHRAEAAAAPADRRAHRVDEVRLGALRHARSPTIRDRTGPG